MSSWFWKIGLFGLWPIARNTPVASRSSCVPLTVSCRRTPTTRSVPSTSTTSRFQCTVIFGLSNTRCCMILLARKLSRRWIMCTLRHMRVKKVASSIAVSPPPMTTTSWSR